MEIFQKIINREIPSEIIYEDDKTIAFLDINPKRKGHFLVVPKIQSTNFIDIDEEGFVNLMKKVKFLSNKYIKDNNKSGYNIEVNNGKEAGQEIFWTHVHVIPSDK